MSEIEKAIAEIIGTNYGECQCHRETMTTALSALREKAEREKGCEFCETFDFSEAAAKIELKKYAHIHLACGSYRYPKEEQFQFCPMCGKPLKDGAK